MTEFHLKLLGRAIIEGPDGPLRDEASQRRRLALLAVLALSPDGVSSRQRLMACLWPESDEKHARHALSNSLYVLRKALGDDAVLNRGDDLQLDIGRISVDVSQFEAASGSGDDEEAVRLYRGPLLDGFHLDGTPEFERWVDAQRHRLAQVHEEALERLALHYMTVGRERDAVSRLRRLSRGDPYNTRVALLLMEALTAAGDAGNAIEFGYEHAALLHSDLGLEMPRALGALIDRLRSPEGPATGNGPETAVLPTADGLAAKVDPARHPLPPFVARDLELTRLHDRLQGAVNGQGQLLLISGEAGTGKTALAREFCRQALEVHHGLVVAVGKGNAHTGSGDPYLPFREILALLTGDVESGGVAGSLTRLQAARMLSVLPHTGRILALHGPDLMNTFLRGATLLDRARKQAPEEEWTHDLASLIQSRPVAPEPAARRTDLFRQYVRVLHELARERPLLLVLDDLQWADLGSIDLFFQLGREIPSSRILVLGLYRKSEVALRQDGERHPLDSVLHELVRRLGDIEIPLLQTGDREFVDALLDLEPNRFDPTFREAFFEQTRGHALFTVELLREMREKGILAEDEEGYWDTAAALNWQTLPARVEAVIGERIDRLPLPLREALVAASVEGEEFTAEAIAPLCSLDVDALIGALSQDLEQRHHLVGPGRVRWMDGRRFSSYRFRHVLFQKYLYDRLDGVERPSLHEKLGWALEELYGDRADDEAVEMARHFGAAGLADRAAHYLRTAGEQAMRAAANLEAIAHFRSALEALLTLPPSMERDRRELEIQVALGNALMMANARGQEEVFTVGAEMASALGDRRQLFSALAGLYLIRGHMGGDNREGRELAERCLSIARDEEDTGLLVYAHEFMGRNAQNRGEFRSMLKHYEELASLYDRQKHHSGILYAGWDPGIVARCQIAHASWFLGYPDRAASRSISALEHAGREPVPLTLPFALDVDVLIHMYRRDAVATRRQAEKWREVATEMEQGFWEPYILISLGWCDVMEGSIESGIALLRKGWDDAVTMGFKVWFAYFTSLLAQALGMSGRAAEGLAILDEAHVSAQTLEELVHDAEIRRIRGELFLALPDPAPADAEAAFRRAIEVARAQECKSSELRAATSLARLLRDQGRGDQARTILGEIYGWFTEGFDTQDLSDARSLLSELNA